MRFLHVKKKELRYTEETVFSVGTISDSFRAENGDHVRFLKRNALVTRRLLKFYLGGVLASGVLWVIFPLINRKSEQAAELTAYFPFDVQQSPAHNKNIYLISEKCADKRLMMVAMLVVTLHLMQFECASIWLTTVLIIQGYGNVTMDCMIAAFYAQARTQLRILRYNFERICDTNVDDLRTGVNTSVMCESYAYKDVGNEEYRSILQRKLIRCVEHYRDIVWFIDEVESLFGEAMTVQFLIMVWVICMTTYKIVDSERINESVFRGRWWLLSPRWRRQLLVVMARYLRCIRPRAAYVISLSLDTYISHLLRVRSNRNRILVAESKSEAGWGAESKLENGRDRNEERGQN
ncbi:hypothetical protein EVAR_83904_1 [Eumeta japonica]|uniref:Odorant receptor n=1 Tax=Eumeta variegata TaxID=151549 RepID=A0A4C1UT54_EUMVA|nr:hypothetical protein EVAR_83904_1 [Eumeta japonica]